MEIEIDVDDDLLAAAQHSLQTVSTEDTVNEALRFVAQRRERIQELLPDDPNNSP